MANVSQNGGGDMRFREGYYSVLYVAFNAVCTFVCTYVYNGVMQPRT